MEQLRQDPERAQWESIQDQLEMLGALLEFDDAQQAALAVHTGVAEHLGLRQDTEYGQPDLETACWLLRESFDNWRGQPVAAEEGMPPAVLLARAARQSNERMIVARLLGRERPYQAPQSFAMLTQDKKAFQVPLIRDAMQSIFNRLVAFESPEMALLYRTLGITSLDELDNREEEVAQTLLQDGPSLLGEVKFTVSAFMAAVPKTILSREEEQKQARLMRGDDPTEAAAARRALIEHNLRWAAKLAFYTAYTRPGTAPGLPDMIQVANLGLIRSVDKFDPDRQRRLTNYATKTILGLLRRWLAEEGLFLVGDNRYKPARRSVLENAHRHAVAQEGPHVTVEEVARRMGIGMAALDDLVHAPPDPRAETEFDAAEDRVDRARRAHALWSDITRVGLSERELRILDLRYRQGLTAKQVATREGGISHQAISQAANKALAKVRLALGITAPPPRVRPPDPAVFLELCGEPPEDAEAEAEEPRARAALLLDQVALPDRTRQVLELRFGLNPLNPTPLQRPQIAKELGISPAMAKYYEQEGLRAIKQQRTH